MKEQDGPSPVSLSRGFTIMGSLRMYGDHEDPSQSLRLVVWNFRHMGSFLFTLVFHYSNGRGTIEGSQQTHCSLKCRRESKGLASLGSLRETLLLQVQGCFSDSGSFRSH